ncbi:hypothetical protein BT63DRAFT_419133 [Microthyrium microscopicum]|uniref:Uncharacterized protein n=1 Tax=Microthyrium microscopicum TaxID=703497 RepID=A0A6A6TWS6_9PEZI|nr:hypothetical protein BT63DRAFT_419133 [Microthyrium microscopicum]
MAQQLPSGKQVLSFLTMEGFKFDPAFYDAISDQVHEMLAYMDKREERKERERVIKSHLPSSASKSTYSTFDTTKDAKKAVNQDTKAGGERRKYEPKFNPYIPPNNSKSGSPTFDAIMIAIDEAREKLKAREERENGAWAANKYNPMTGISICPKYGNNNPRM